jgi:hypothetical protein
MTHDELEERLNYISASCVVQDRMLIKLYSAYKSIPEREAQAFISRKREEALALINSNLDMPLESLPVEDFVKDF